MGSRDPDYTKVISRPRTQSSDRSWHSTLRSLCPLLPFGSPPSPLLVFPSPGFCLPPLSPPCSVAPSNLLLWKLSFLLPGAIQKPRETKAVSNVQREGVCCSLPPRPVACRVPRAGHTGGAARASKAACWEPQRDCGTRERKTEPHQHGVGVGKAGLAP